MRADTRLNRMINTDPAGRADRPALESSTIVTPASPQRCGRDIAGARPFDRASCEDLIETPREHFHAGRSVLLYRPEASDPLPGVDVVATFQRLR